MHRITPELNDLNTATNAKKPGIFYFPALLSALFLGVLFLSACDPSVDKQAEQQQEKHEYSIFTFGTLVDVSLDGGRNWRTARIDGPSLSKSLHRFYFDFEWDGKPLLLQSRAIDSTGYVQPTKDALRKVRGTNSIYHNNGIQTWHVRENGTVENVEVS